MIEPFIKASDFTLLASIFEVGGVRVDTHWENYGQDVSI